MSTGTITHADVEAAVDNLIWLGKALTVQRAALIAHGDRDLVGFARRVRTLLYGGAPSQLSTSETASEVSRYLQPVLAASALYLKWLDASL